MFIPVLFSHRESVVLLSLTGASDDIAGEIITGWAWLTSHQTGQAGAGDGRSQEEEVGQCWLEDLHVRPG